MALVLGLLAVRPAPVHAVRTRARTNLHAAATVRGVLAAVVACRLGVVCVVAEWAPRPGAFLGRCLSSDVRPFLLFDSIHDRERSRLWPEPLPRGSDPKTEIWFAEPKRNIHIYQCGRRHISISVAAGLVHGT